MADTRWSGTTVNDAFGNNATKTHLSTNIIIKVDGNAIGAVKTLSVTEARNIAKIAEIGTDGFIDSAPQRSTEITVRCERTRFARKRIAEAFGRGFIHVSSQRIPFNIEIHDIFSDTNISNAIITTIENCWISNMSYNYSSDDFIIAESMDVTAERIYSTLNGGYVVNSSPTVSVNQFEAQADAGQYIGALNAAGLLNAFLDDPRL
jgi:hypothetical protein